MQDAAKRYCADKALTRREPIYSANRLIRLCGPLRPDDVTEATIETYRAACVSRRYKATTTESSISDVIAVVAFATGRTVSPGRRLHRERPQPDPVSLDQIDAVWPYLEPWLQQWIIISYWTCLRLSDAIRVQFAMTDTPPDDVLTWQASKTGHRHRYPVPDWLRPWLVRQRLPYYGANDYGRKLIRHVIASVSETAGIPVWTPKRLRQCGLSEWSAADGEAGRLIHGCGLGVMRHYVDPLRVLSTHQHKVRLPQCFGAGQGTPDITVAFRRLDIDAQQLVCRTIERLTG